MEEELRRVLNDYRMGTISENRAIITLLSMIIDRLEKR